MDVMNVEQAKVAEEAGAVAVMALERIPSLIRSQGGIARMVSTMASDPGWHGIGEADTDDWFRFVFLLRPRAKPPIDDTLIVTRLLINHTRSRETPPIDTSVSSSPSTHTKIGIDPTYRSRSPSHTSSPRPRPRSPSTRTPRPGYSPTLR